MKHTILIVDDEYSNYEILAELIESFGAYILYAANGQEAVDVCRNNDNISLVLMDIKMPKMDGSTATKLIKEFRPSLPIVAQTAYALASDREQYLHAGFDEYLVKPLKHKDIIAVVSQFIK